MPGQTEPAPRRLALLIATSDYNDPTLRQLRAPGRDASELAEILGTPHIGGFAVQTLINARCGEVLEATEEFCADRRPDDQLLIYLSCHGVLDNRGRLYYAATDTRRQRTAATAVAATWLNDRLEDCRARSQIVILDCCHSGAFAGRIKGEPELALEQRFKPRGRGRVVLTASRGTEYSFEGDHPSGDGVQSVFTKAIVDGLRTGDADLDKDGLITVTETYHYVYERVRVAESRQTPELFLYGAEGDILLANSVRAAVIEPVPLPEDLRVALEIPRPRIREAAVAELAELLGATRPGLALSARQALQKISEEDIPRVAAVARAALEAWDGTEARKVTVEARDVDKDRERVSLSLKSTQEGSWQQFARTYQVGQFVPGRVTKLVPFGAFVRVWKGVEGLVHISELADRHVEIPEQVVQVGNEIFVKVIDIDLDRHRISLSLKQANEGTIGEGVGDDFDPTLYGLPATYDEHGNYEYPEGFDPKVGEWLPGYEKQRDEWERQYAEARARFEAHRRQVEEFRKADEEEAAATNSGDSGKAVADGRGTAHSSRGRRPRKSQSGGSEVGARGDIASRSTSGTAVTGMLASDEALAALREKLSGGQRSTPGTAVTGMLASDEALAALREKLSGGQS